MKISTKKNSLTVICNWLDRYTESPNTYRAYYREFERLQTWLLCEDIDFAGVTTLELEQYLSLYAGGEFSLSKTNEKFIVRRSHRSVLQVRGVLNRLFRALQFAGVRKDNPIEDIQELDVDATDLENKREVNVLDWHEMKKQYAELPEPVIGARESIFRGIAIVELSFWISLQRSELASASMADFKLTNHGWILAIRRFGKGNVSYVSVPKPAIDALRRYRLSRGLMPMPSETEIDIPLISRLRSEAYVDSWTIANAIKVVSRQLMGKSNDSSNLSALTPRLLRKYLVTQGLSQNISAIDMASHVRSDYAIYSVSSNLVSPTFLSELEQLELN